MKNDPQQNEQKAMAQNAINPSPSTSTQPGNANEPPIDPRLQRWIDFCEQTAKEAVKAKKYEAQFIKNREEIRKTKAEKRVMAKLRKLEVEQKAVLLAEAQEARRKFESQEHPQYDSTTARPPSIIEDIKAHNDLRALDREQKEELLREVMEKRAKEAGDDWPRIQAMSQDPRFDHIPKCYPGEREMIEKAFCGPSPVKPKESDE
jgi:hypothetical protein